MPKLMSYHPSISVEGKDGELSVIRCDLPDYETDDGVLKLLGDSFGVSTAGDLVNAVKDHLYGLIQSAKCRAKLPNDWDVSKRLADVGCRNLEISTSVRSQKYGAGKSVSWGYQIR